MGQANYLAFIKLASIRPWLRTCESTPEQSAALSRTLFHLCQIEPEHVGRAHALGEVDRALPGEMPVIELEGHVGGREGGAMPLLAQQVEERDIGRPLLLRDPAEILVEMAEVDAVRVGQVRVMILD